MGIIAQTFTISLVVSKLTSKPQKGSLRLALWNCLKLHSSIQFFIVTQGGLRLVFKIIG